MSKLTMMRRMQLAAATGLVFAAGAAQAQWMWIDAKGLRQVSDQAPPPSVPLKSILKSPGRQAVEAPVETAEVKAATLAAAPSRGTTLADREADYRKRMTDKTEQDKQVALQDAQKAQKDAACRSALANKAKLGSGERLRVGEGRSEFMGDEERARKTVAVASFLSTNCQQ